VWCPLVCCWTALAESPAPLELRLRFGLDAFRSKLLALGPALGAGATGCAPFPWLWPWPGPWPTCRRFRRVTNSVLRLLSRCCRWTASLDEDASEEKRIKLLFYYIVGYNTDEKWNSLVYHSKFFFNRQLILLILFRALPSVDRWTEMICVRLSDH